MGARPTLGCHYFYRPPPGVSTHSLCFASSQELAALLSSRSKQSRKPPVRTARGRVARRCDAHRYGSGPFAGKTIKMKTYFSMCNQSKPRSQLGLCTDDAEGDVAPVDDDDLTDVVLVVPQSLASCRLLLLRRPTSLHLPLFSPISVTRTLSLAISLSLSSFAHSLPHILTSLMQCTFLLVLFVRFSSWVLVPFFGFLCPFFFPWFLFTGYDARLTLSWICPFSRPCSSCSLSWFWYRLRSSCSCHSCHSPRSH